VRWSRCCRVPERRFRYPGRKRYPERACLEGILTVLRWGIPLEGATPDGRAAVGEDVVGAVLMSGSERVVCGRSWLAGLQERLALEGKLELAAGAARLDESWTPKQGRHDRQKPGKQGPALDEAASGLRRPGCPLGACARAGQPARPRPLAAVDAVPCLRVRRRGRENRPTRLLADRGYDADWLRDALRERGITPLIPRKRKPGTGRVRDAQARHRWPIERTNAWLHNQRRLKPTLGDTRRALPRLRPTRRRTHPLPTTSTTHSETTSWLPDPNDARV